MINFSISAISDPIISLRFKGQLDPFTKCRKLRQLILCHNQLEGPVPVDIGSLLSLEIFYASYNQLCGALPQSICHLGTLSKLNLSNNVISGILPPAFGDLVKLEICILGQNYCCENFIKRIGFLMIIFCAQGVT